MMLKHSFKILFFFLFAFVALISCKTYQATQQTYNLDAVEKINANQSIIAKYTPFKDSLDKTMKVKIATLQSDVVKAQPTSTLTNLMADILFHQATKYIQEPIDFAVMNYGGIRLPSLSKGDLLIETAYQLMPFDNYIVALQLNGTQVQELCNIIASKGGWPISHLQFMIDNNQATNILINNKPLQSNKTYTVAMIDYIANGGDDMAILKSFSQISTGVLLRNAIIEYLKEMQTIFPDDTKRINHAK